MALECSRRFSSWQAQFVMKIAYELVLLKMNQSELDKCEDVNLCLPSLITGPPVPLFLSAKLLIHLPASMPLSLPRLQTLTGFLPRTPLKLLLELGAELCVVFPTGWRFLQAHPQLLFLIPVKGSGQSHSILKSVFTLQTPSQWSCLPHKNHPWSFYLVCRDPNSCRTHSTRYSQELLRPVVAQLSFCFRNMSPYIISLLL